MSAASDVRRQREAIIARQVAAAESAADGLNESPEMPAPAPPEHWQEAVEQALEEAYPCAVAWKSGGCSQTDHGHHDRCPARHRVVARKAVFSALAGVELASAASELRLRSALDALEDREAPHGECLICEAGKDDPHGDDCSFAALATPPSTAAEVLADLLALPGRLERRAAEFSWESANTVGGDRELVRVAREVRAIIAKLGGTT